MAARGRHVWQPEVVSAREARRLLLGTQGLLDDPTGPANAGAVYRLIDRLGYVQIDSINVIERSHHLVLASRLDGYRPATLARLHERDRRLFEHWTHDASLIPTKWYRFWVPRFERYRKKMQDHQWWRSRIGGEAEALLAEVMHRIERDGPVVAQDFEHKRADGDRGAWWGWKPQKAALEFLWWTGVLAVVRRVNFHKVYDLAGRTYPKCAACAGPSEEEHVEWACSTAMDRLVAGTTGEIGGFWGAVTPAEVRRWCESKVRAGELVPVVIESAGHGEKPVKGYAIREWRRLAKQFQSAAPPDRMRLLSPFDPVMRNRKRALRVFAFDFRFEAFVPAAKRRYGYYVMPILDGDRFIGRLDPKFHREESRLEVKGVWWERGARPTKARRTEFEAALDRLCGLIGAERWKITKESTSR